MSSDIFDASEVFVYILNLKAFHLSTSLGINEKCVAI